MFGEFFAELVYLGQVGITLFRDGISCTLILVESYLHLYLLTFLLIRILMNEELLIWKTVYERDISPLPSYPSSQNRIYDIGEGPCHYS